MLKQAECRGVDIGAAAGLSDFEDGEARRASFGGRLPRDAKGLSGVSNAQLGRRSIEELD